MSDNGQAPAQPAKRSESAVRQILASLVIVGICGIFLRFGSLIVTMAVSHLWDPEDPVVSAWAFLFRQLIMVFIYPSVLNLFRPAFIPLYNEIKQKEGPEAAMVFARGVLEIGMFLALLVFGVIWFWPDLTVSVMAPRFSPEQHAASVALMRQMAPGILFLLVAEMYLILFHAEKKFAYPHGAEALQKIAWGCAIVAGAKLLGGRDSVIGTATGGLSAPGAGDRARYAAHLRLGLSLCQPKGLVLALGTAGRCWSCCWSSVSSAPWRGTTRPTGCNGAGRCYVASNGPGSSPTAEGLSRPDHQHGHVAAPCRHLRQQKSHRKTMEGGGTLWCSPYR